MFYILIQCNVKKIPVDINLSQGRCIEKKRQTTPSIIKAKKKEIKRNVFQIINKIFKKECRM